jgi:primosomal protein N'
MFVVQVTPLIRGTQLEALSYFSTTEYPLGSFVSVPIRGKTQPAIVTDSRPVTSSKTELKAATFSLRKLPHQEDPVALPPILRETAEALAGIYPASTGALLYALLPPDIRNGSQAFPDSPDVRHSDDPTPQILTARVDDRFLQYQSTVRSVFARKGSVLFVVPTTADVDFAFTHLSQGIKERVVVFAPHQTTRQRRRAYERLGDTTHPQLIIVTPSYAYLNRSDIKTIIMEQAASGHYVSRQRPYLDHRTALMTLAKAAGRSLILGDVVHRTEDEIHRRDERYLTLGEEAKRLAFNAPLSIVTQRDKPKPDQPFQLFSQELLTSVERTLEGRGHVFFYSARRGLAPVVACIDCGHIFRCPDSNTPYSLIRTFKDGEEQRWFVSSTSGRRVRAADVCPHCGSWRLRERGIGIQQVYYEFRALYPDTPVFLMDQVSTKTPKQAQQLADAFFGSRFGILIGTQIALPFLSRGVELSAIISLDAARSIPTWRADETFFRLLLRLRECTTKEVVLQSRTATDDLLIHASRGAIERFYDEEISLREMVQYPPYTTFMLLTWSGTSQSVLELGKPIEEALKHFPMQFYNNPNSTIQKTMRHGLLRVGSGDAAAYALALEAIRRLPPFVKVEINPERIV